MEITGEISKKITNLAQKGAKFLFLIDFDGNGEVYTPNEARDAGILFEFQGDEPSGNPANLYIAESERAATAMKTGKPLNVSGEFKVHPVPYATYLQAFNRARLALQRGDTYLLNLTFATPVETQFTLDEIFKRSKARYKLLYKNRFVVFSPERFIWIHDGIVETNPMKGTIDASSPDAERKVLELPKEHFEHNTIVDLLRNDLNMVASNVKVEKFRYIEKIDTNKEPLLQVSSLITGRLPENYIDYLGEIVLKLLPAGSVTGAPKERTVQIIKEIENYRRGFYTGVFGYFDGSSLDVAVAIRFIENINGQFFYKSGGGITALSNPLDEYNELLAKIYVPFI
ncbi:MAG TPA: aminodeoxychorismate synthase component I [Lentimicrobium sp.]|nr:aminodeoxychorismate synthase component I [Lentimicrobium sp.]